MFKRLFTNVASVLDINKATLSGALDVIVVKHDNGEFKCTPFHVRFGKLKVLRSRDKLVHVLVNGEKTDLVMQLSDEGDAYFITGGGDLDPVRLHSRRSASYDDAASAVTHRRRRSAGDAAAEASVAPALPTDDAISGLPRLEPDGVVTVNGLPVATAAEWDAAVRRKGMHTPAGSTAQAVSDASAAEAAAPPAPPRDGSVAVAAAPVAVLSESVTAAGSDVGTSRVRARRRKAPPRAVKHIFERPCGESWSDTEPALLKFYSGKGESHRRARKSTRVRATRGTQVSAAATAQESNLTATKLQPRMDAHAHAVAAPASVIPPSLPALWSNAAAASLTTGMDYDVMASRASFATARSMSSADDAFSAMDRERAHSQATLHHTRENDASLPSDLRLDVAPVRLAENDSPTGFMARRRSARMRSQRRLSYHSRGHEDGSTPASSLRRNSHAASQASATSRGEAMTDCSDDDSVSASAPISPAAASGALATRERPRRASQASEPSPDAGVVRSRARFTTAAKPPSRAARMRALHDQLQERNLSIPAHAHARVSAAASKAAPTLDEHLPLSSAAVRDFTERVVRDQQAPTMPDSAPLSSPVGAFGVSASSHVAPPVVRELQSELGLSSSSSSILSTTAAVAHAAAVGDKSTTPLKSVREESGTHSSPGSQRRRRDPTKSNVFGRMLGFIRGDRFYTFDESDTDDDSDATPPMKAAVASAAAAPTIPAVASSAGVVTPPRSPRVAPGSASTESRASASAPTSPLLSSRPRSAPRRRSTGGEVDIEASLQAIMLARTPGRAHVRAGASPALRSLVSASSSVLSAVSPERSRVYTRIASRQLRSHSVEAATRGDDVSGRALGVPSDTSGGQPCMFDGTAFRRCGSASLPYPAVSAADASTLPRRHSLAVSHPTQAMATLSACHARVSALHAPSSALTSASAAHPLGHMVALSRVRRPTSRQTRAPDATASVKRDAGTFIEYLARSGVRARARAMAHVPARARPAGFMLPSTSSSLSRNTMQQTMSALRPVGRARTLSFDLASTTPLQLRALHTAHDAWQAQPQHDGHAVARVYSSPLRRPGQPLAPVSPDTIRPAHRSAAMEGSAIPEIAPSMTSPASAAQVAGDVVPPPRVSRREQYLRYLRWMPVIGPMLKSPPPATAPAAVSAVAPDLSVAHVSTRSAPAALTDVATQASSASSTKVAGALSVSASETTDGDVERRGERDDDVDSLVTATADDTASDAGYDTETSTSRGGRFEKTRCPTSAQLAALKLRSGENTLTFMVSEGVSVTSKLFLWSPNTKVVISDVDGTITKSDVLGHIFFFVGRDWTHAGVAQLYSNIRSNGYQIVYLTSRAIGQTHSTKEYLQNIRQFAYSDAEFHMMGGKGDLPASAATLTTTHGTVTMKPASSTAAAGGAAAVVTSTLKTADTAADTPVFQLPAGPVITSPDRLMTAFTREVLLRQPHLFKIAALSDIKSVFPPTACPFYAGFGNRDTDVLAYRAVGVQAPKIFIINPDGEIRQGVGSRYRKSYPSINSIVTEMFPAVTDRSIHDTMVGDRLGKPVATEEAFGDVAYWRPTLPDIPELAAAGKTVTKPSTSAVATSGSGAASTSGASVATKAATNVAALPSGKSTASAPSAPARAVVAHASTPVAADVTAKSRPAAVSTVVAVAPVRMAMPMPKVKAAIAANNAEHDDVRIPFGAAFGLGIIGGALASSSGK